MVDATTTSKTRLDTPPLGTFVCDDESDNSSWELTMDMTLSQIRVALAALAFFVENPLYSKRHSFAGKQKCCLTDQQ
jgi:hypothetical protein